MPDIELRTNGKLHAKLIVRGKKVLLEVKSRRGKHYYDLIASIKQQRSVILPAPNQIGETEPGVL